MNGEGFRPFFTFGDLGYVLLLAVGLWWVIRRAPGHLERALERAARAGAEALAKENARLLDGRLGWIETAQRQILAAQEQILLLIREMHGHLGVVPRLLRRRARTPPERERGPEDPDGERDRRASLPDAPRR